VSKLNSNSLDTRPEKRKLIKKPRVTIAVNDLGWDRFGLESESRQDILLNRRRD
jgi:hypothetical protein